MKQKLNMAGARLMLILLSLLYVATGIFLYIETGKKMTVGLLLVFAVLVAWLVIYFYMLIFLRKVVRKGRAEGINEIRRDMIPVIFRALEALAEKKSRLESEKRFDDEEKVRQHMEALQSQINPHFLYNSLDSIRGTAMISGNDTIATMIEMLSSLFRYSISKKGDTVTLSDELQNIEQYFKIHEFRYGDRYKLEVHLNTLNDPHEISMPKMILQPIVENCLIHGLGNKEEGGTVKLFVLQTKKYVEIEVSDDGVGISEETVTELNNIFAKKTHEGGKGFALHNVRERIRLLYGEKYGLKILSLTGFGTQVIVSLPFCESFIHYTPVKKM